LNVWLVNKSTVVEDKQVESWLAPLTVYSRHIRQYWGSMQPGVFAAEPKAKAAWQLVIVDDADQAGALGYHDIDTNGRPVGFVFAKTVQEYGYDLEVTVSHEFAEILLDPFIRSAVQTADNRFHAQELCDPVEADNLAYKIAAGGATMLCSDFVTPYWFQPGVNGRYDHEGYVAGPLEVLDGGYAYCYEDGQWYSEDHLGKKRTPEEHAAHAPHKSRLGEYARSFGS
jgi:hypothetical protein